MSFATRNLAALAGIVFALIILFPASASAQSRGTAGGYLTDSKGNVITSGSGECPHSGNWTPEDAVIDGCDGVVADVNVEIIEGQPTGIVAGIVMPASALFEFDKSDLTAESAATVEKYLIEYREDWRPELAKAYAAIIIGHTDSRGNPEYNIGLSERRAEAVADFLVANDVPPEKLRILGRGANAPIASNDTDEGRAQNRRVEIIVIAEARALDALRFPSVALFPRRSAELTTAGTRLLNTKTREAQAMLKRAAVIDIVGHTDDVGDSRYNQELSELRAISVRDRLIEQGIDESKIAIWGAGEEMPIASNRSQQGRADNRRVEIFVLGRLKR